MAERPVSTYPQSEEGLQGALAALKTARETGDSAAEGWLLLDLAHLVKWVRSDNEESSFERAHTLSCEAITAFRSNGDNRGVVRALCSASSLAPPKERMRMLAEAEHLARDLGDRAEIAHVLSSRSRILGMTDRAKSAELAHEALAIYRDLDNAVGMGGCLFTLSIHAGESNKRGYAAEAYECFFRAGKFDDAARMLSIAMMNCTSDQERLDLEPMYREALEKVTSSSGQSSCVRGLAQIGAIKGNVEEVGMLQAVLEEIEAEDGLPPRDKWEMDVMFLQMLIQTCKRAGHKEALQLFKDELRALRKHKPPVSP